MRSIKFRAWEKNLKEIIPVADVNFETKMISTRTAWRLFDEIELMQFTGLCDKNGVEIYEHDVIQLDIHHSKLTPNLLPRKGIVEWLMKRACWNVNLIDQALGNLLELDCSIEVIGNIYENPELVVDNNA